MVLRDNKDLKFNQLGNFDKDMIKLNKKSLFKNSVNLKHIHEEDKIIAFERGIYYFVLTSSKQISTRLCYNLAQENMNSF